MSTKGILKYTLAFGAIIVFVGSFQVPDASAAKLKKAELQKLFPATLRSVSLEDGTKCTLKYLANGNASGSCKGPTGKSSAPGSWKIRGNKFCDKWTGAWKGEGGCSSIEKEGSKYFFIWRGKRVTQFTL